ncbi:MAG: beta strand repeat-containing protein, partial [Acidimicrobiia bacterium]
MLGGRSRSWVVVVVVTAVVLSGVGAHGAQAATSGGVAEVYQVVTTPTSMNAISPDGQWAVGDAQSSLFQLTDDSIGTQTTFPAGFYGFAVNDSGVVAGSDNGLPAIYDNGTIDVPTAPATYPDGTAAPAQPTGYFQAINDAGLAVGKAGYGIAGNETSFSYLTYLYPPGCNAYNPAAGDICTTNEAVGVNASGTIVAPSEDGYATWNGGGGVGSDTPLAVPPGLDQISLQGNAGADFVNDSGVVLVGGNTSGQDTANIESACYTSDSGSLTLVTSNSNRVDGTNCVGINAAGTVVGEIHPSSNVPTEAFVWTPGGGVSLLSNLIGTQATTLSLTAAYGISNTGVIVGASSGAGGGYIAFPAYRITGQVTDTGANPVSGVTVTATATSATAPAATATTDANGDYELDVVPGVYTVALAGLATGLRSDPLNAVADTTTADTAANFVVTDGPVVQSLSPTSGPITNAGTVTVNGAGFGTTGSADTVQFCAVGTTTCLPGTGVTVASDSSLTVTPPADATSLLPTGQPDVVVDVIVTDTNGNPNLKGASDRYQFDSLGVTGVNPTTANPTQPIPITVSGFGFSLAGQGSVSVGFYSHATGQLVATASAVNVSNDGTITATTPTVLIPTGLTQLVTDVRVTVNGVTSPVNAGPNGNDTFTFTPFTGPSVTSLSQTSGPIAGGTQLTINGSGFTGAIDVQFIASNASTTGVGAPQFVSASDTQIVIKVPPQNPADLTFNALLTDVEVDVTRPDNSSASSPAVPADHFTYTGPIVTSLSQTSGPIAGGTQLTINGSGFTGVTGVYFLGPSPSGNVLAEVGVAAFVSPPSDSQIVIKVPPADPAELTNNALLTDVDVEVTAPGFNSTVQSETVPADQFTYTGNVAPPCGILNDCQGAVSNGPTSSAVATSTSPTGSITATGSGVGGITVGRYPSNPAGTPTFSAAGSFFDVSVSSPNSFTAATIQDCDLLGGNSAQWWNPVANGGAGAWQAVTPETLSAGPPACLTITVNATSSPTLAQLTGTVFAIALAPTKLSLLGLPFPLPARVPVVYLASVSKGSAA